MSPEWACRISKYLELKYIPSALIIRAPWVKGLLANVPFHEWFYEHGITEITDSFGETRQISDIDCIISKSQFKMHKVYDTKCRTIGVNAWDYYTQQMRKNHLLWGIARLNNHIDAETKTLNYQFLQAVQLDGEDVDELCKETEEFLQKLNSGDIETVYKNLMINGKNDLTELVDDEGNADESIDNSNYKKLFQQVIEANPAFINDKYIRELIFKESSSKFENAKLGKILVRGNFQFCISDPMAQLEWIANNHCNFNIAIKGVVAAGYVYSNYWMNADDDAEEIVLMRSPLIDQNEIAKRKLTRDKERYFRYLTSGLIYSIHDLTALQQGGCDFDGDISFSTNNRIILKGSYDYDIAKPLYYDLATTSLVGRITDINIIKADIRGLNSAVGKISNKVVGLYAKLQNYPCDSAQYKKIYDNIIALGQVVGMEIDRIKTGVQPTMPLELSIIQNKKYQNKSSEAIAMDTDEEQAGINRHNELIPNQKPYFFRYNYPYIDKHICTITKNFDNVSKSRFGLKFAELKNKCDTGLADDAEVCFYEGFRKSYPVIDSDCIVNHVCHNFERFKAHARNDAIAEGKNMLADYADRSAVLEQESLDAVERIIEEYAQCERLRAKLSNMNVKDNRKTKCQRLYETHEFISRFYRDKISAITGGNLQLAFDLLIAAAKGKEKEIWSIMGNSIIPIIRKEYGA